MKSRRRIGVLGGVRSGVVEECPESKSGLPRRSTGRTKDKCVLESDVRTSSNCKTVLFDRSDTRVHGIQREKRASTRASRTYICRRGGGISQGDGEEEGRKKEMVVTEKERGGGRAVLWALYKLSYAEGEVPRRSTSSPSLGFGVPPFKCPSDAVARTRFAVIVPILFSSLVLNISPKSPEEYQCACMRDVTHSRLASFQFIPDRPPHLFSFRPWVILLVWWVGQPPSSCALASSSGSYLEN